MIFFLHAHHLFENSTVTSPLVFAWSQFPWVLAAAASSPLPAADPPAPSAAPFALRVWPPDASAQPPSPPALWPVPPRDPRDPAPCLLFFLSTPSLNLHSLSLSPYGPLTVAMCLPPSAMKHRESRCVNQPVFIYRFFPQLWRFPGSRASTLSCSRCQKPHPHHHIPPPGSDLTRTHRHDLGNTSAGTGRIWEYGILIMNDAGQIMKNNKCTET